jgi:Cu/Ag efflux pump CusA
MLVLPVSVYAQSDKQGQGESQQQGGNQGSEINSSGPGWSGNQVQNENQVATKNYGEESQLMVATKHMEQLMDMEGLGEELDQKVKEAAQEQMQAQNQIQSQLNKLESKSKFMKKLFGPDFKAIANLKTQIEQNKLRIQLLTEIKNEVANETEEAQLQEAVSALTDQNTKFMEFVQAEEQVGSMFGWLVKLFN